MEIFKDSKTIWRYLKKYKARVYFIVLIALAGSFVAAVIPYIYGRLVDIAVVGTADLRLIVGILLFWLALSLLSDWFSRFVDNKGFYIAIDASTDFLLESAGHLLKLPLSFHKDKKIGEFIQRSSRGSNYLERIIANVVFNIGPSFLTIIGAVAIMIKVEWRLALILSFVLVFYSLATIWKTKPIIKSQREMHKYYEKAYGNIYDSITNIQTVKSFTNEKTEELRMSKDFRNRADAKYKSFLDLWRDLEAWQRTIFSFGFVFVFGLSVFFLRQGIITPGQLIMFFGYVNLVFSPFARLADSYRELRSGLTAISRVEKMYRIEPEAYQKNKEELVNVKGRVEFQNVDFEYQKKKNILKDISFKTKPGQMIALVGESGVGKTTLVDLISRYYIPKQGKILIDGRDIAEVNLESLRKQIAVVPQEVVLFNDTIKNNIRYGRQKASDREIIEAAKTAHVHEFIQKFDKKYNQLVGERGIRLSTGQKQRVAIARAILRDPKILILDEATSSLDSATERLVQEALDKLVKGRTTFVIAHRLSTIQKADLILVLDNGCIVERGDHQELIDKGGVYKKLSRLQSTFVVK